MTAAAWLQIAFIGLLVLLRLFEREMDKSRTPFDPFDRIADTRRHLDRTRQLPAPKDLTALPKREKSKTTAEE